MEVEKCDESFSKAKWIAPNQRGFCSKVFGTRLLCITNCCFRLSAMDMNGHMMSDCDVKRLVTQKTNKENQDIYGKKNYFVHV